MPLHHRKGHGNSQEGTKSSRSRCTSNWSVLLLHTIHQACSPAPIIVCGDVHGQYVRGIHALEMRHIHYLILFSTIS